MDWTQIIVAFLGMIPPTLAVVWSSKRSDQKRSEDKAEMISIAEKNASKQAILNMMTQDIIYSEILKKPPENHQAILKEFDEYTKSGGNSWLKEKMDIYIDWYNKNC